MSRIILVTCLCSSGPIVIEEVLNRVVEGFNKCTGSNQIELLISVTSTVI